MHCNCSNRDLLALALRQCGSALKARWTEETASTNDDLKALVRSAEAEVSVVLVADRQTAGRGTRGRTWTAPAVSVLLTAAVPLPEGLSDPAGLSLAAGAACLDALSPLNPDVRLKWPNDIWVGNGKAAGLLCEIVRSRSGRLHAVAGIGVNIGIGSTPIASADVPAVGLLQTLPTAERTGAVRVETAARLACALETACRGFGPASLEALRGCWAEIDAFAGLRVSAVLPSGETLVGRTDGIGAHGELLFVDEGGRRTALTDARLRPLTA